MSEGHGAQMESGSGVDEPRPAEPDSAVTTCGRLFARAAPNKVVLFVQSAHRRAMAKTWVSKNVGKSQKAFVKAMRLMVSPKGRRNNNNYSRPR
jgi:hypothetical protein